jgi:hypothetical protein
LGEVLLVGTPGDLQGQLADLELGRPEQGGGLGVEQFACDL